MSRILASTRRTAWQHASVHNPALPGAYEANLLLIYNDPYFKYWDGTQWWDGADTPKGARANVGKRLGIQSNFFWRGLAADPEAV